MHYYRRLMSVGVIIVSSKGDRKKNFYLPVSTEDFFNSYWLPACKQLNLRWIACFCCGIMIEREDLPAVLIELDRLKNWAIGNLEAQNLQYMTRRIDLLTTQLPLLFENGVTSIYIG